LDLKRYDAFTAKLTTQTSLAFEKASIIFQMAATHSAVASTQNRSDPEGLKRAFHYFRTSAGMLTYINDNFLHAPSTDLSRDVVKFLVGIVLAQATEVFFEKLIEEKKSQPAFNAKVAAQAAFLYSGLTEEVKEFYGKGVFDRNWVTLLQVRISSPCSSIFVDGLTFLSKGQSEVHSCFDALSSVSRRHDKGKVR
jgi:hypothetical protein